MERDHFVTNKQLLHKNLAAKELKKQSKKKQMNLDNSRFPCFNAVDGFEPARLVSTIRSRQCIFIPLHYRFALQLQLISRFIMAHVYQLGAGAYHARVSTQTVQSIKKQYN
jgi:hypothetical protein